MTAASSTLYVRRAGAGSLRSVGLAGCSLSCRMDDSCRWADVVGACEVALGRVFDERHDFGIACDDCTNDSNEVVMVRVRQGLRGRQLFAELGSGGSPTDSTSRRTRVAQRTNSTLVPRQYYLCP